MPPGLPVISIPVAFRQRLHQHFICAFLVIRTKKVLVWGVGGGGGEGERIIVLLFLKLVRTSTNILLPKTALPFEM